MATQRHLAILLLIAASSALLAQYPNSQYGGPGYPNQGYPNQGYPNAGGPNQGYPNQGYPGQGYPNQAPNQGYPNQNPGNQPQEAAPAQPVARIAIINGDVSVMRGDSGEWT